MRPPPAKLIPANCVEVLTRRTVRCNRRFPGCLVAPVRARQAQLTPGDCTARGFLRPDGCPTRCREVEIDSFQPGSIRFGTSIRPRSPAALFCRSLSRSSEWRVMRASFSYLQCVLQKRKQASDVRRSPRVEEPASSGTSIPSLQLDSWGNKNGGCAQELGRPGSAQPKAAVPALCAVCMH